MITKYGYLLIMVKIELSDMLKLIKHQVKIFQFRMTMVYFIKLLEDKFTHSKNLEFESKMTSNQDSKLKHREKTF